MVRRCKLCHRRRRRWTNSRRRRRRSRVLGREEEKEEETSYGWEKRGHPRRRRRGLEPPAGVNYSVPTATRVKTNIRECKVRDWDLFNREPVLRSSWDLVTMLGHQFFRLDEKRSGIGPRRCSVHVSQVGYSDGVKFGIGA